MFRKMCLFAIIFIMPSIMGMFDEDWGLIRYVHQRTNIRSTRSSSSDIVGVLEPGQKVKVDFLEDNWFAVFTMDENERDEGKAIGFVYAPLLKPDPLSESDIKKKTGILKYKIVKRKDVSYQGTSRMTFRIVLNVSRIPTEKEMKDTATEIWEDGNKSWAEFTVFMYLPDMNTNDMAYAVAEFRRSGMKEFKINEYALYGTKWKKD
jgi:hypothetical protein